MKNGEIIGTQAPTGHVILVDARFELPYGKSSDKCHIKSNQRLCCVVISMCQSSMNRIDDYRLWCVSRAAFELSGFLLDAVIGSGDGNIWMRTELIEHYFFDRFNCFPAHKRENPLSNIYSFLGCHFPESPLSDCGRGSLSASTQRALDSVVLLQRF